MTSNKNIVFDDITRYTSEIVNEDPNIAKVAMEYLHPRNTHPESLKIYYDIFQKRNKYFSFLKNIIKSVGILILSIYRNENFYFGDDIRKKTDILFISHLTNIEQLNKEDDNYFGTLIKDLSIQTNIKPLVALINHTWLKEKNFNKKWQKKIVNKVILSRTNNLIFEIKYILMLLKQGRKINNNKYLKGQKKIISDYASCNAVSTSSLMALRTYYQIKHIIKKVKPKYLVTTFEGHSWERLVFHAAKVENKNIKCIGYQHSVLFPNQFSIFRKIDGLFNPDIILTPGKISYEYFKEKLISNFVSLQVLGSPRSLIVQKSNKANSSKEAILVLPEGIKSETIFLFTKAINMAKLLNKRKVILRAHPILNINNFRKKKIKKSIIPLNIEWSSQSLEYDLSRSSIAIYRGSSTIITAVINGLYPIYISKENDHKNIDPLFLISKIDRIALSEVDLVNKILTFESQNNILKKNTLRDLKKYCNDYFIPLSFDNFIKILDLKMVNMKVISNVKKS